jgi:predicted O-methyltransferase YrrM
MSLLKKLWHQLVPAHLRSYIYHLRAHYDIIEIQSGNFRSLRERMAVDKHGDPLPWYTYPAIEFLKQINFSGKDVFEYGTGNSTPFWARRAKSVTSVEHDAEWFNNVKSRVSGLQNVRIIHCEDKDAYANEIQHHSGFDVIVIDGLHRLECARASAAVLRPGGIILLDNSDVCPKSAQYLRQANLIQVDMIGIGPGLAVVWATSLFLHREFSISGNSEVQPDCGKSRADYDN